MQHITLNTAQKDFGMFFNNVVEYGEPVSIATDDSAAILVSKEDWEGMMETLYLKSIPGMDESIKEGKATPLSECVPLSEVWPDV